MKEFNVELLGKEIQKYRTLLGLSQKELSKAASVSQSYIDKIEKGNVKDIGIVNLSKIANGLKIDLDTLLSGFMIDSIPADELKQSIIAEMDILSNEEADIFLEFVQMYVEEKIS